MVKVHMNITVDYDVWYQCKQNKINVSKTCNDILKRYMKLESNNNDLSQAEIDSEMELLQAEMVRLEHKKSTMQEAQETKDKQFTKTTIVDLKEVKKK